MAVAAHEPGRASVHRAQNHEEQDATNPDPEAAHESAPESTHSPRLSARRLPQGAFTASVIVPIPEGQRDARGGSAVADDTPSPIRWAPGWPAGTYHIVEREPPTARVRSLCNLVLDVTEAETVAELPPSARHCRSCLEIRGAAVRR